MPTILLRIFLLYKLLNVLVLYLVPKKLRAYLPTSWYPVSHHQHSNNNNLVLNDKDTQILLRKPIRKMDRNDLKRCFEMFDRNNDGRITKSELNGSLENIGIFIPDKDLVQMIDKVDANGDGCVDIEEFEELYRMIMDERGDEEEHDMKEAFNVFDRNGDGYISADELRSVLKSLGLKQGKIDGEECEKMITKVDVDGNGLVDFNEFKEMMRGGGAAAGLSTLIN